MFKVECPGCKAPYQVDERRIPPSGLKMRCPKCGTSFKVDPPSDAHRTGPSPVLGAVFGMDVDSVPPPAAKTAAVPPAPTPGPPIPRTSAMKTTMAGVAPQSLAAGKGPLGLEPARAPLPSGAEIDFDLPSPAPDAGLPIPASRAGSAARGFGAVARAAPGPARAVAPAGPAIARPAAPAPAPRPVPAAAPAPPRREQPSVSDHADLPAPAAKKTLAELPSPVASRNKLAPNEPEPSFELDLPSIAEAAEPPPPRRPSARAFGDIEHDLPASAAGGVKRRAASAPAGAELDLPSPARTDLPEVRPARGSGRGLPELSAGGLDLPDLSRGGLDLPDLSRGGLDLPDLSRGGLDLPDLSRGGLDLPDLSREGSSSGISLDLPDLAAGLPSPATASLPTVSTASLPTPATAGLPVRSTGGLPAPARAGLPAPAAGIAAQRHSKPDLGELDLGGPDLHDNFGELDLPLVTPPDQAPRAAASSGGFGELTGPDSLEADPFAEASLPPLRASSASVERDPMSLREHDPAAFGEPLIREQGGGTSYGEVNLAPSDGAEVPLDAPPPRASMRSEEDMEFGGVPQESAVKPVKREVSARAEAAPKERAPSGKRLGLKVAGVVGLLLIGGASLALVPRLGPFGAYWVLDRVRAGEYEQLVASTVARARRHAEADSFAAAKLSLAEVEAERQRKKRVRALTAYASFMGFARELRFGADPEAHGRARVLLEGIEADSSVPYVDYARAARAGSEGQLARARQLLVGVSVRAPRDPDVLALKGEIELRARDAKAALAAYGELAQVEDSARAAFGLARARFAADDLAGAEREAERALAKNPRHLGARILVARIAASTREREPRAIEWLDAILKDPRDASPDELVRTHTLLGDIHLSRSRISRAEAAYGEALKIDPKAARALIGLGEALYRAGRYSEAQARFEAGSQADPDDVLAKVGVAKSKLLLERLEDAHGSLKKLQDAHRGSTSVAYWYGRVLEAIGNRDEAERVYREAIAKAGSDPVLVDTYISLALLQNQQGRAEDAKKTLKAARDRLPRSSAIHRALGDVALTHGRYGEAQAELGEAIRLDPEDLGAKFRLGSALRRDGKFDEALKVFEEVKAIDRDYPGLALEHGLVYEASGRTEEALKAYEQALAKAPDDPDLMLRVGCGYASAGRTKESQTLLRKVLALRPTSAETNHCLGRALLAEGSRLADALRQLDRAVELDPHKAEYHLYVGWAANEAGNVPKAEKALDEAIKLDQGLADAYWQRGVLRARQGAVREAIADLNRALTLRPSRHEAHAALADAYYDSGKEDLALSEWRKAVTTQPDNATWRFRYGKLLAANQMNEAARAELAVALELADKTPEGERWVWEAHHFMARALGARPEAARHWEQFLRLGPVDSPYRSEAKAALQKLGKSWSGE
jgi:predicted Zn finger-like uncharacterized protein